MPRTTAPDPCSPRTDYWVICLCADWCGLCREYQEVFARLAARYPHARFAWLDIEDQAGLLGDVDVETFPTLLVADAEGTRFFGPITPQSQTLSRLLDSLERGGLQAAPHAPATQLLLQALRAAPEYWITA